MFSLPEKAIGIDCPRKMVPIPLLGMKLPSGDIEGLIGPHGLGSGGLSTEFRDLLPKEFPCWRIGRGQGEMALVPLLGSPGLHGGSGFWGQKLPTLETGESRGHFASLWCVKIWRVN